MNLRSNNPLRRQLRQKQATKPKRTGGGVPVSPSSPPKSSSSSAATNAAAKPLRPLTAYHIYFQLEREYIIQSTAGDDADPSLYHNKSYLNGVPRRYRTTRLPPDWFAGPGKRKKRKHRKSHGKIGFLELSRVISRRWATLDSSDPETKQYVTAIANRELAEYKVEMEAYKEATAADAPEAKVEQPRLTAVADGTAGTRISPRASPNPFSPPEEVSPPMTVPSMPALSPVQAFDEIDYSICSVGNNGNYIPSPGHDGSIYDPLFELDDANQDVQPTNVNAKCPPVKSSIVRKEDSICDPLFELEGGFIEDHSTNRRCVSPMSVDAYVDTVSDVNLLQLLP